MNEAYNKKDETEQKTQLHLKLVLLIFQICSALQSENWFLWKSGQLQTTVYVQLHLIISNTDHSSNFHQRIERSKTQAKE